MHWRSREYAIEELSHVMAALCDVVLIIQIDEKRELRVQEAQTASTALLSQTSPVPRHARFTVHAQIRDFVAYHMPFFTPDRGDRNYFQVSLYCDQPRDLPTPTHEHYRMARFSPRKGPSGTFISGTTS